MKINREEALRMLYGVADGEVTGEKRAAFFQYLKKDETLRWQYEQVVLLKHALRNRLKREPLPAEARERMVALMNRLATENESIPSTQNTQTRTLKLLDRSSFGSDKTPDWFTVRFWIKPLRTIAAAAVLLAMTLFTIEILDRSTTRTADQNSMEIVQNIDEAGAEGDLEQIIYELFSDTGSFGQDPFWSFAPDVRIERVKEALQTELRSSARLPEMNERHLRRIYGHTFFADHKSPVLAYHHPQSGEWIYIFAFDIIDLEQSGTLHRDPAAVRYCQKDDLYHVKQIGGKDIVSWQWEGHWYTAISNHKGDELIALLE